MVYQQSDEAHPQGLSPRGRRNWKLGAIIVGVIAGAAPVLLQVTQPTTSNLRGAVAGGLGLVLDIVVNAGLWLLLYWGIFAIVNSVVKRRVLNRARLHE